MGDQPSRNNMFLFWASFLTLIAAGIGFSVRGIIVGDWGSQYGFTLSELGTISGGGLIGFGLTIIALSFVADKVGYGKLMLLAFLLHASSAIVTFAATPVYAMYGKEGAYWCLTVGMWLFAFGNGACECVINPLTASLFPNRKTHWLNILHAGWPLGLILGALIGLGFQQIDVPVRWEFKLGIFLIPVLLYGLLMFNRVFPRSEASLSGISVGTMIASIFTPILLFLFLLHAMVGYVELGTDSWIVNITQRVLSNATYALLASVWINGIMFTLRFFAGPIVHKINPVGLLLISSILGCTGLALLGSADITDTIAMWMVASTIFALGKTFYWPTLLGVVSENFPRGGALALGISGGIGMISAGYLGVPGIGYKQDYFAVKHLKDNGAEATYERYVSRGKDGKPDPKGFPIVTSILPDVAPPLAGLDGSKKAAFEQYGANLEAIEAATKNPSGKPVPKILDISIEALFAANEQAEKDKKDPPKYLMTTPEADALLLLKLKKTNDEKQKKGEKFDPIPEEFEKNIQSMLKWWDTEGKPNFPQDKEPLNKALVYGARKALFTTAGVPAAMAVGFLLLLLYFAARGGYKQVHIGDAH